MKKSELKAIIRECINESKSSHISFTIPKIKHTFGEVSMKEMAHWVQKTVDILEKDFSGLKFNSQYNFEADDRFNFSMTPPQNVEVEDIEEAFPAAAKKVDRKFYKMVEWITFSHRMGGKGHDYK